ncbi:MAG: hypothetical protein WCT07_03535 [Candidatus Paceibacterota bacterium]|jgi:hypothetical protein
MIISDEEKVLVNVFVDRIVAAFNNDDHIMMVDIIDDYNVASDAVVLATWRSLDRTIAKWAHNDIISRMLRSFNVEVGQNDGGKSAIVPSCLSDELPSDIFSREFDQHSRR